MQCSATCIAHLIVDFITLIIGEGFGEIESHVSSVGIALGYRLDDRGSRVRFPAGAGNFSLHHRVQTGSGAYSASYPVGTHSLSGAIPPLPQYSFMAWCLVKHRDNFYLFTFSVKLEKLFLYFVTAQNCPLIVTSLVA
jgi:hypothetical protein